MSLTGFKWVLIVTVLCKHFDNNDSEDISYSLYELQLVVSELCISRIQCNSYFHNKIRDYKFFRILFYYFLDIIPDVLHSTHFYPE